MCCWRFNKLHRLAMCRALIAPRSHNKKFSVYLQIQRGDDSVIVFLKTLAGECGQTEILQVPKFGGLRVLAGGFFPVAYFTWESELIIRVNGFRQDISLPNRLLITRAQGRKLLKTTTPNFYQYHLMLQSWPDAPYITIPAEIGNEGWNPQKENEYADTKLHPVPSALANPPSNPL